MARGRIADRLTFGPARRRRQMLRRLRELDRLDAAAGASNPWADLPPAPGPYAGSSRRAGAGRPLSEVERRERRRRRSVAVLTALVVLGISGLYLHDEYGLTLSRDGVSGFGRLGPLPDPGDGGAHAFAQTDQGQPVTYSPCRPLEVVVNRGLEPPGTDGLVEEAVARVAEATGLQMTVVGGTDEPPSDDRELRQPVRYGAGWAPVLVAWTTPEVIPGLAGDVVGLGGSAAVSESGIGLRRYVTGTAWLDAPALADLAAEPQGRALVRAVIMHELGHVVGLDHVDDRRELMYAENGGAIDFGPGDLEGLARLGTGPCR
ncbi:matrixin family metalloprotease [Nocardioides mesophilus]|uniref:Matrixin family metalloprotease n=1 Tax=Nocardioides mesophilus TaxID=433659 RepID=A0A7G9R9Y5_9ACTN|nr:matrixin family metalloprotease [Nocardioides mesophilus]QNN52410.1 matrixin family metalloprotease [Nocardioides mesophilus]